MTKQHPSSPSRTLAFRRSSAVDRSRPTGAKSVLVRQFNLANFGHLCAIGFSVVAAVATAVETDLVQVMERQAQTLFFELRGPVAPPEQIVILAMDEDSIAQGKNYQLDPQRYQALAPLVTSPWKRAAYAEAIDRLMAAGAKSVALDLILDTPSSHGEADDQRLQQSLQRFGKRVTLAASYEESETSAGPSVQLIQPHAKFQQTPVSIGFINYPLDFNGKIHYLGSQYPKLVAQQYPPALAKEFWQLTGQVATFAESALRTAQLSHPKPGGNHIFFYGPRGSFKHIPFWQVLDPDTWNTHLQTGVFKGKIVLIGPTATLYQDFHSAPFAQTWLYPNPMPGVEINANATATLLEGKAIANAIPDASARGAAVLSGLLVLGLLLSRPKKNVVRFACSIGVAGIWGAIGYLVFTQARLILPTAVPVATLALSGLSYLVIDSANEQIRKLRLRRTLERYAASPLVQEIISQQDEFHDLLREREKAMLGKKLGGRYSIVRVLSSGGFGETYVARDMQRPGNPQCVVKQLKPASDNPKLLKLARRMFEKEAETLERLGTHDQIPHLLAYFEEDQEFYLVQEFIAGHPLSHELSLGRQLPESQVLYILKELLQILEFVHSQGVIHRDIKPSNIIRRESDNKLVLIDFGAVKEIRNQLTDEEAPSSVTVGIGTQGYMPSEQCAGNPRFNSDIYAIGMTAIQSLTGLPPSQLHIEPKTGEILWRHKARVSHGLAAILGKMVRYHFNQRYQSATEVLQTLQKMSAISSEPMDATDLAMGTPPGVEVATSTMPWPDTFGSMPQPSDSDTETALPSD